MILSSPSTAEQRLHGPQSTHEGGGERALSSQPSLPLQQGHKENGRHTSGDMGQNQQCIVGA